MEKPKLIMYKGLPASGKSTMAKEYQKNNPNTKRVNKDDLRAMLDNSAWSKDNEKDILYWRDTIVAYELRQCNNVIVDDTNLHPKHETALRALAAQCEADFEIVDLTGVPLEECLQRDAKRPNSVGKKVILGMWNQFLKPAPLTQDMTLPSAVAFDLDGTLCNFGDNNPYARDFMQDTPNIPVVKILNALKPLVTIFILSGRDSKYREITLQWFKVNNIIIDHLIMRPLSDKRPDEEIKKEFYFNSIKDRFNLIGIFDDRLKVIRMWESLGLFVFNVNQGLIEF